MAHLNRWEGIGYLAKDPKVTTTTSGGEEYTRAWFRVVMTRKWKDKRGETQEETHGVDVVVWSGRAKFLGEHARRGSLVYVAGELQQRSWEADGVTHYGMQVRASDVQLLGNWKGEENRGSQSREDADREAIERGRRIGR